MAEQRMSRHRTERHAPRQCIYIWAAIALAIILTCATEGPCTKPGVADDRSGKRKAAKRGFLWRERTGLLCCQGEKHTAMPRRNGEIHRPRR